MTERERVEQRLREAVGSAADGAPKRPGCPDDAEIWAASRGELSLARAEQLLAHSLDCPACAESWTVAARLAQEAGVEPAPAAPLPFWSRRLRPLLALGATAAAILVVALLGPWFRRPDALRDVAGYTIESRLDATQLQPRQRCVLSWSAGPPGSLYTVEVVREDLTVIGRAEELPATEWQVPASVLRELPPRSVLLWRVDVVMPDGSRVSSPVFRVVLE